MPLLDLLWTFLWFFLFITWIWLLITIFADIFQSELSGWGKAGYGRRFWRALVHRFRMDPLDSTIGGND